MCVHSGAGGVHFASLCFRSVTNWDYSRRAVCRPGLMSDIAPGRAYCWYTVFIVGQDAVFLGYFYP